MTASLMIENYQESSTCLMHDCNRVAQELVKVMIFAPEFCTTLFLELNHYYIDIRKR